jgi:hypothetical protein
MSQSVVLKFANPRSQTAQATVSQRQPELDALRGLLLIAMALTHLPTHASYYAYQPFGFVAAAEGFIFVSAMLTGKIYGRLLNSEGVRVMARRLWERAAKLYGYHLLLLAVAFTVVAALANKEHQPALQGLLDFYLAHRGLAVFSSILLVYCPPLLDILPMYIVFLLLTPLALFVGQRWRWIYVFAPAGILWVAAQFGLREMIYAHMVRWIGLAVPLQNMGAFNLYAWQFLWVAGLWSGIGAPDDKVLRRLTSRGAVVTAFFVAAGFLVMRYQLIPYLASHPVDQGTTWVLFDKWRLGVGRLVNFTALGILFAGTRFYISRWLAIEPLVVLGQSSLEVFSFHLLFCFGALAWIGDGVGTPFRDQLIVIGVTFTGIYALAFYRFQQRKQRRAKSAVNMFSRPTDIDFARRAA